VKVLKSALPNKVFRNLFILYCLLASALLFYKGTYAQGSDVSDFAGFEPAIDVFVENNIFFYVVEDLNQDSILDVAFANANSNEVSVVFGNGVDGQWDGTFTDLEAFEIFLESNTLSPTIQWIATDDFNSDGIPDLVTANGMTSNTTVLLGEKVNSGDFKTTYSISQIIDTGYYQTHISIFDVNGDEIIDIAILNFFEGTVSFLIGNGTNGNGNGTFNYSHDIAVGPTPVSSNPVDLNNDDILDLVVANSEAQFISVLFGMGENGIANGQFDQYTTYPVSLNFTRACRQLSHVMIPTR